MERGRKTIGVLLLTALLLAVGVLSIKMLRSQDSITAVDLYFLNESVTSIVSEKRDIKHDNTDELVELVITELSKGPLESGNKRIMPKNTIWTFTRDSSRLLVDFSQDFLTTDNAQNLLSTYAVVKSLCSIHGISAVKVTVAGGELIAPDNSRIDYISDKDINLEAETNPSDTKSVKLYFATEDGLLSHEWRTVKLADTVPVGQNVVSELIKGPQTEGLMPSVSADTQLVSVEITEGTAYINMHQSFIDKNSQTPEKERIAVYSIVNSLSELDGVVNVQFLIDGKKTTGFKSIDLSVLLTRNDALIK
ncbi:MAG: GerMN domain-containing protein [Clostridia bacterium]|nr:GerMN domain-containing protein [Clostridia bacterium]